MVRFIILLALVFLLVGSVAISRIASHHLRVTGQKLTALIIAPRPATTGAYLEASPFAAKLITAARAQIGETLVYDGSYQRLAYPMGDVPRERGVCTDVVIRALRDAHGIDLQQAVHDDMKSAFSAYPAHWGLTGPDRNIDHRRVPNLQTYLQRRGASLAVSSAPTAYRPADIVTWQFGPGQPHIGLVSDRLTPDGARPLILHNVGAGTREEDFLFAYPPTGHYRLN